MYIIMSIIGIICIITIITFLNYMDKRTEFGAEMLGKIKGFKRFLEIAEKQQLEDLVTKNPEYFYNILPYTYALRVSDIWVKQFETMATQYPKWYSSDDTIQNYNIENFVTKTMKSIEDTMSTKPMPIARTSSNYHSDYSSWSSNSSGGGFSGGAPVEAAEALGKERCKIYENAFLYSFIQNCHVKYEISFDNLFDN